MSYNIFSYNNSQSFELMSGSSKNSVNMGNFRLQTRKFTLLDCLQSKLHRQLVAYDWQQTVYNGRSRSIITFNIW